MRSLFSVIGRFGSPHHGIATEPNSAAHTAGVQSTAKASPSLHPSETEATRSRLRQFVGSRDGNVAIIFTIMMIPTIYLAGMMMDYTQAYHKQSQLDAAADAAAIAAVTPAMMAKSASEASTTAQNVFNATANGLHGLAAPPTLTVNVSDSGYVRTAAVSYTAASTNNFPVLLGPSAWPIRGSSNSTATSGSAMPNINFYLVLDDSPSMAIAGTPADIQTMLTNTPHQDGGAGCAFACHESNPSADNLGNPNTEDNYALAQALGVTLRIDLMKNAVASLMSTARSFEQAHNTSYRMAIYTFDYAFNTIYAPSGQPSADLTTAASQASNIAMPIVYKNNWLTSAFDNDDTDTDFDNAMQAVNTNMPAPGGGTNAAGDTPQEVVFIVTDGVDDKTVSHASDCSATGTVVTYSGGVRCEQPFDTTWCTTIKNRGIRVAVVYTEYLQLPTDSWYNNEVAPFDNPTPSTSPIATNLQACASPGLFYDVASGGNISQALDTLFQLVASAPARLTQ